MRLLGVLAAVSLALSVASPARAAPAIEGVAAATASTSATVTWRTSVPTRGRVAYGVDGIDLYSAPETGVSTTHSVVLTDLTPSTTYAFEVVTPAARAAGALTTAAARPNPRFAVDGTRVTADGSLFFPVLSYYQCGATADAAVAAGINVFMEAPYTACTRANPNDFATDPPPPGVMVLSDDYSAAGVGSAGWYLPDEPDGWGIAPAALPQLPPAAETGKLRVLNVSQHFFSGQAPIGGGFDRADYTRFAALADVVGFDMYPIVKFCGRVSLLDVFRAQRELATTYAAGKPTFQWIETGPMTGECASLEVTPQTVEAETWLAIAGGACGIGYFTSSWTGKLWSRWDLAPGVEAGLAHTVARVRALAPALCAQYGDVTVPWNGTVAASSRTLNGALYVIAVNASAVPTRIPFRVDALAGRTLEVLGESREITPAKKVYFRDSFGPYQVHIYVAPPE